MDASATPPAPTAATPSAPVRLMLLGEPAAAACADDACELPALPATAD